MAEFICHHTLYEEVLEAAFVEIQDLAADIEHLQDLLDTLESRKEAVEGIYNAIQYWVELGADADSTPLLPAPQDEESAGNSVALTQEEVALLLTRALSESPERSH